MRVIVIGTGGVGGYFGASLLQGGCDVRFVARVEHLAALRKHGLRVESNIKELIEDVLLVRDEELIETIYFTLERMKVLVEPSGIAAAAAVRHREFDFAGKRVGVVLSGGNVDLSKLAGYLKELKN